MSRTIKLTPIKVRKDDGSFKEIDAIGGSGGGGDGSTNKRLLQYDGTSIKDPSGNVLTHDAVYSMLMESPDFVVLVYEDRAYHPNFVGAEQIIFSATLVSSGYIQTNRITLLASNQVAVTYGKAEVEVNKVDVINDTNKDSDKKYPSVKAVADYVDGLFDGAVLFDDDVTAGESFDGSSFFGVYLQNKDGTTLTFEKDLPEVYDCPGKALAVRMYSDADDITLLGSLTSVSGLPASIALTPICDTVSGTAMNCYINENGALGCLGTSDEAVKKYVFNQIAQSIAHIKIAVVGGAGDGGSTGGVESFRVNFTPDSFDITTANWSCDKTYEEIEAALLAGKYVYGIAAGFYVTNNVSINPLYSDIAFIFNNIQNYHDEWDVPGTGSVQDISLQVTSDDDVYSTYDDNEGVYEVVIGCNQEEEPSDHMGGVVYDGDADWLYSYVYHHQKKSAKFALTDGYGLGRLPSLTSSDYTLNYNTSTDAYTTTVRFHESATKTYIVTWVHDRNTGTDSVDIDLFDLDSHVNDLIETTLSSVDTAIARLEAAV